MCVPIRYHTDPFFTPTTKSGRLHSVFVNANFPFSSTLTTTHRALEGGVGRGGCALYGDGQTLSPQGGRDRRETTEIRCATGGLGFGVYYSCIFQRPVRCEAKKQPGYNGMSHAVARKGETVLALEKRERWNRNGCRIFCNYLTPRGAVVARAVLSH